MPQHATQQVSIEPLNEESLADCLAQVRLVARKIYKTLPPSVDFQDLVGAGMLGLVQAARSFDPQRGIRFRTYAEHRIAGAIRDSLRALDPLSRGLRQQHRLAEHAITELQRELARPPTEEEIAGRLHLPLKRWRTLAQQLYRAGIPLDGTWPADNTSTWREAPDNTRSDPAAAAAHAELRRILDEAIRSLPTRHQKLIRLYYYSQQTMTAIGGALGVKESRISQMHTWALTRLRRHLPMLRYR